MTKAKQAVSGSLVVSLGIIDVDGQVQLGRRQLSDRSFEAIAGDDFITLRLDEIDPGLEQIVLLIQDIERGALADRCLLP